MAKYGKKAQDMVERAMKKRKAGTLKSGSGRTVRSREQAIAIGLSEAREKGGKVPTPKKSRTTGAAKKRTAKKSTAKKRSAKKSSAKKRTTKKRKS